MNLGLGPQRQCPGSGQECPARVPPLEKPTPQAPRGPLTCTQSREAGRGIPMGDPACHPRLLQPLVLVRRQRACLPVPGPHSPGRLERPCPASTVGHSRKPPTQRAIKRKRVMRDKGGEVGPSGETVNRDKSCYHLIVPSSSQPPSQLQQTYQETEHDRGCRKRNARPPEATS